MSKPNTKPAQQSSSKYPPKTIAYMYPNEKFGEGALKSMPLTAEGYDVLQDMGIGYSLVLKPGVKRDGSPVLSKNGDQVFFLEKLPPLEKTQDTGRRPTRNNDDL